MIVAQAKICRFCGQETGFGSQGTPDDYPRVSAKELPAGYKPPVNHIDEIYQTKLRELQGPTPWKGHHMMQLPRGLNPKRYEDLLTELGSEAWRISQGNPETASRWLYRFKKDRSQLAQLVRISKRNSYEADWAAEELAKFYARYTKSEIIQVYILYLQSVISQIVVNSKGKEHALSFFQPVAEGDSLDLMLTKQAIQQAAPEDFRLYVLEEARKHIDASNITGSEYVVPIHERPRFVQDLPGTVQKVIRLIEGNYVRRDKSDPSSKIIVEDDMYDAIAEIAATDERYQGMEAFVALHVRGDLKGMGYKVTSKEWYAKYYS